MRCIGNFSIIKLMSLDAAVLESLDSKFKSVLLICSNTEQLIALYYHWLNVYKL